MQILKYYKRKIGQQQYPKNNLINNNNNKKRLSKNIIIFLIIYTTCSAFYHDYSTAHDSFDSYLKFYFSALAYLRKIIKSRQFTGRSLKFLTVII